MKRIHFGFLCTLAALLASTASAVDCTLGARYLALANDRVSEGANEAATQLLRQSIEACPTYGAYEQLGDLTAQSSDRKDKADAVQAFIGAHALAPDNKTRAHALLRYADLLMRDGDPQNAYPLIKQARRLDPTNKEIETLAAKADLLVQNPKPEHIVRGLRDSLFRPLRIVSTVEKGGSSAGTARVSQAVQTGPQISIRINFETNSTLVDRETRPNIETLAHTLAGDAFAGQTFRFVGHADARGTDVHNLTLSKQRADALSQSVVLIEPALEGRIKTEGRGSEEPVDPGTDEAALRANRRLQVTLGQ